MIKKDQDLKSVKINESEGIKKKFFALDLFLKN